MRLLTRRLELRPWAEQDAEELFKYAKDPRIGPIAGWLIHTSVENSREIIRGVLSAPETYAVILRENGLPVGSIGIIDPEASHVDISPDDRELGFWVGVPYWGQGIIPEAVHALLARCFDNLGCNAVWCGYYDGNDKSRRCQEKCGFRYHHTEYGKSRELMGDVQDEHFTRITSEEWAMHQGSEG